MGGGRCRQRSTSRLRLVVRWSHSVVPCQNSPLYLVGFAFIVLAFEEAESKGLGVVSLGSKMIDAPVVKRALATVEAAMMVGALAGDWRDEDSGEKPGARKQGRSVEKGGQ